MEFSSAGCQWLRPTSLDQLQILRAKHNNTKYIGGGSGNYKVAKTSPLKDAVLINLSEISELRVFRENENFWEFGAALTLSEMLNLFNDMAESDSPAVKVFQEVLSRLASTQIRNMATVGGALMWPHSSSDLMLLCSALKCTLNTISTDGCPVEIEMGPDFYPHGMEDIATQQYIIKSVRVPKLTKGILSPSMNWFWNTYLILPLGYKVATFKKGRRKTFDLAILNVVAVMKHDGFHVQDFTALIGGSCGKSGESMEKLVVPTEFLCPKFFHC